MLGFQITDNLDNYLGVLLFNARTKKNTFQFIIDKVQAKINGNDAKLLSLTGRVMIAKSILLTISGYFMQSGMIPIGVCEQDKQIMRRFVWDQLMLVPRRLLLNGMTVANLVRRVDLVFENWYLRIFLI